MYAQSVKDRYKDDDTIVINVNEIITSKSVKPKKFLLFI